MCDGWEIDGHGDGDEEETFWWKGENKAMVMMRCIISYDGDKNQMTLRNSKR